MAKPKSRVKRFAQTARTVGIAVTAAGMLGLATAVQVAGGRRAAMHWNENPEAFKIAKSAAVEMHDRTVEQVGGRYLLHAREMGTLRKLLQLGKEKGFEKMAEKQGRDWNAEMLVGILHDFPVGVRGSYLKGRTSWEFRRRADEAASRRKPITSELLYLVGKGVESGALPMHDLERLQYFFDNKGWWLSHLKYSAPDVRERPDMYLRNGEIKPEYTKWKKKIEKEIAAEKKR